MNVGEAVAIIVLQMSEDDACPFCAGDEAQGVDGYDPDPDCDEDADGFADEGADTVQVPGWTPDGKPHKNDASALGRALGETRTDIAIQFTGLAPKTSISAAHHLIPGNGSLKPSKLFTEDPQYLRTDDMNAKHIGYNVNNAANGVWLPGNYAIRPWRGKNEDHQTTYAFASIRAWEAQFHDAHREYNDFVRDALDQYYAKLNYMKEKECPKDPKKKKKHAQDRIAPGTLRTVIMRLNALSETMRGYLCYPHDGWYINVFTSKFSKAFMEVLLEEEEAAAAASAAAPAQKGKKKKLSSGGKPKKGGKPSQKKGGEPPSKKPKVESAAAQPDAEEESDMSDMSGQ